MCASVVRGLGLALTLQYADEFIEWSPLDDEPILFPRHDKPHLAHALPTKPSSDECGFLPSSDTEVDATTHQGLAHRNKFRPPPTQHLLWVHPSTLLLAILISLTLDTSSLEAVLDSREVYSHQRVVARHDYLPDRYDMNDQSLGQHTHPCHSKGQGRVDRSPSF